MAPNRRTNKTILAGAALLVIVVAAIVTAGCTAGTSTPGTVVGLTGVSWSLDSYLAENSTLVPALPGSEVSARFGNDGKVVGSAGCNHYGADYTLKDANLFIEPAIRTEMYCMDPPGIMEQEDRYLALLTKVASYRVERVTADGERMPLSASVSSRTENDRLVLTDVNGADILVFEPITPKPDLPLTGTDWVLDGYSTGGDAVSSVIAGTTITAKFAPDGNITGNAGCNHYGGRYSLNGANFSVSSLFSTLMYCEKPEGVMEQEGKYLGHLGNVSSYRVEGDRLILSDKTGTDLLFFVQAQKLPQAPLTGTLWTLESYSLEGDAVSSVIAGTTVTAEFAPDGNVTGSAGCNRYFAAYEVSGKTMTIGPAGSTKMYCGEPEGIMEQEARYLSLLESVAGCRIDGDRLDLLDEAGKTLLSYRAESVDQP